MEKLRNIGFYSKPKIVDVENARNYLIEINRMISSDIFDFLIKYNGAQTIECNYRNQYSVNRFLPFFDDVNPSIKFLIELEEKSENPENGKNYLPFANDMGGRPFYISLSEGEKYPIYVFRSGMDFQNPELKIADSFYEFIENLEE